MLGGLAYAYSEKEGGYFDSPRQDIVEDMPQGSVMRVLEIGCGTGATGTLAKSLGRAAHYVGVELNPAAAAKARLVLDDVVEGNIETMVIPFAPRSFDVLILSEVLEHLIDPWAALKRLAPALKSRGTLYVSSPNVAHISILRMLLRNRWDYTDRGHMDWTHLRWFTPATYREMIEAAGFQIIWLKPVARMSMKQRVVNTATFGLFSHIFMSQIFVKAERA